MGQECAATVQQRARPAFNTAMSGGALRIERRGGVLAAVDARSAGGLIRDGCRAAEVADWRACTVQAAQLHTGKLAAISTKSVMNQI